MSEQRYARQKPDPITRMIVMLKNLQQEVRFLKEGKTQEVRDNVPPMGNQPTRRRVSSGRGSQPLVPNTGRC